jgi:hypothetical protein
MSGHDFADRNWKINANPATGRIAHDDAELAVLMDIRTELQQANKLQREANSLAIANRRQLLEMNTRLRRAGYLLRAPKGSVVAGRRAYPKA